MTKFLKDFKKIFLKKALLLSEKTENKRVFIVLRFYLVLKPLG